MTTQEKPISVSYEVTGTQGPNESESITFEIINEGVDHCV